MLRRLALVTSVALVAPLLVVGSQAATPPPYTVRALTVTAPVAALGTLGPTRCTVDADLYTPRGASRTHRVPAILMTHGYGGSKADNGWFARAYARRGYAVLSYSGLGLGAGPHSGRRGSDCKITFDDRDHDGMAGRALVDFLGGGRKADDGTVVDFVVRDAVAHDGHRYRHDPRVGMIGGSYGGAAQFAVAAVDPRVDTIVPMVTWHDMAFSLAPNHAGLPARSVRQKVPGAEKVQWSSLFLGEGVALGAAGAATANGRVGTCPGFYDPFCQAFTTLAVLGYADATTTAVLRNASVTSFTDKIRVPVLLAQGQADSLFTLREAAATYHALKARRVPVKMVWHSWGHNAPAKKSEFGWDLPDTSHEGRMIRDWFAYWLKDQGRKPSLDFTYYRPWAYKGDAVKAYASAPSYPLPGTTTLYGSGRSLVPRRENLTSLSQLMAAPGAAPMSVSELTSFRETGVVRDVPGSATVMDTLPLDADVDVVGAPTATLRLSSSTARPTRPDTMLVAFVKLYDVAPDNSVVLPHYLVAPIRVADLSKPVTVALPTIVHRFKKGHRIRLVVALTDAAYRGNAHAQVATLSTSQQAPTTLTLPGRFDLRVFD